MNDLYNDRYIYKGSHFITIINPMKQEDELIFFTVDIRVYRKATGSRKTVTNTKERNNILHDFATNIKAFKKSLL